MATKRRLQVKVPQEDEEELLDEKHLPVTRRPDWGWHDWLLRDYLRYWYVAGILFLDVLVVLEINKDVDSGLSISVPAIVLTGLVILEILVFRSLWGKEGRWQKR
jgi:hypothetical protein